MKEKQDLLDNGYYPVIVKGQGVNNCGIEMRRIPILPELSGLLEKQCDDGFVEPEIKIDVSFLLKQLLATFASSVLNLCFGIAVGFSAFLLPKLKEDESFPYTENLGSWIASITPLSMVVGCLLSGVLIDLVGRRLGQILLTIPNVVGWLCMSYSNNAFMMLLGRFLTGACGGAARPVTLVYLGEITDPKYRGMLLFCPSIAAHFGIAFSHLVVHYMPWRSACIVCIAPTIVTFLIMLFLKESPIWLISKGKIEEGSEVFKWFRGPSNAAEAELKAILEKQAEKVEDKTFAEKCKIVISSSFLKPLLTVFVLFNAVQFSGVNSLPFYAQQILERTFKGSVNTLLLVMTTDAIRVISTVIVCLIGKVLPRKFTFLFCGFGTAMVLLGLVTYMSIKPEGMIWIMLVLMVVYIALSGVMGSLSWSFVAEVFPADFRGMASGFSAAVSFTLLFIVVKITPTIMFRFGEVFMYGGSAVITMTCSIISIFTLPRTDGKTLQDIENGYKKKNKSNNEKEQTRI